MEYKNTTVCIISTDESQNIGPRNSRRPNIVKVDHADGSDNNRLMFAVACNLRDLILTHADDIGVTWSKFERASRSITLGYRRNMDTTHEISFDSPSMGKVTFGFMASPALDTDDLLIELSGVYAG